MERGAEPDRPDGGGGRPPLAVAVIGHVDHGKTALVRALTGIETDRLKDEVERGLSITLGFAWRDQASGSLDIIDTPGHEDFVRAMVSGATGARAVLLVVSAVDGVARQTREHLQIAGLLGITHGVVAVTKSDRLAPGEAAGALARITADLAGGWLDGAPMVLCSAVSGDGLDDVRAALETLAERTPPPATLPGAMLPIDRAFTITGTGAVVTGTLLGDKLRAGDEAVLLPSGRPVGLRRLQVHGEPCEVATPGGRLAVSLRGVTAAEVRTGEALCAPGAFEASALVDVALAVAVEAARPLRHMDEVFVHWGARRDVATVRLFADKTVAPGGRALARLRFARPAVAFAGQRGVLRRPSPAETLAGLIVLDPQAPAAGGRPADRLPILAAAERGDLAALAGGLAARDRGLVALAELARLARLTAREAVGRLETDYADLGAHLAPRAALAALRSAYLEALDAAHRQTPTRAAAPAGALRDRLAAQAPRTLIAHVEQALAAGGEIVLTGGGVRRPGHDPLAALSPEARDRLWDLDGTVLAGGLMPPDPGSLAAADPDDAAFLALLEDAGRVISLRNGALRQTLVFHRHALMAGFEALRRAFPPPTAFTTGEARAALGTTRKFIVPVLEHFDAEGLTARQGDHRQVIAP